MNDTKVCRSGLVITQYVDDIVFITCVYRKYKKKNKAVAVRKKALTMLRF